MSVTQELPVLNEQPQSGLEAHDFGRGQILQYSPDQVRLDESTNEPVIPLLYFQGINGDDTLPHVVQALGERDQRQVIGIRYNSKLSGTAEPLDPSHPDYDETAVIPEIDADQADDALAMLDVLGIKQVDALASSRGGLRLLLAIKKRPEAFRNAYGDDIAGQDGRNYRQTHIDALRLVASQRVEKYMGKSIVQPLAEVASDDETDKKDLRSKRVEQQSVATAQLHNLLARIGSESGVTIRLGSDARDKAFRTENVRAMMKLTGADQHVQLVETNKGGHGVGINTLAIDNDLQQLREMENTTS